MCLILFAINMSDDYPFILAANRDEFYDRPTLPMAFWHDKPGILAGKDLKAGGTWFGLNRSGRFAALTNYRDLSRTKTNAPSRGELIPELLAFNGPIREYFSSLDNTAEQYSGFNLLAGDAGGKIFCYSNQTRKTIRVTPGIHGLSNHLLDTPWPKIDRGKNALETIINKDPENDRALFCMLADTHRPQDADLPDTGVGLEWERILSPLFIKSKTYGTRSSTLMHVNKDKKIRVTERTFTTAQPCEDRTFILETANTVSQENFI